MIGAIAGDIIGSVYEFSGQKSTRFDLFGPDSRFTDDTVLTVALADAVISGKDYVDLLKKYYRDYPHRGYGGHFKEWAGSGEREPYYSLGNGAAMRISPVGWAYPSLEETLRKAEKYTAVTHNHPEGIKGAQATASAIFLGRNGASKGEIRAYVAGSFGYDLGRSCNDIRIGYEFTEKSQETIPEALVAFLDSEDYESAVRLAVSLGGDADTLACITGGVAEAFYGGVPEAIQREVRLRLDKRLMETTERFAKAYGVVLRS